MTTLEFGHVMAKAASWSSFATWLTSWRRSSPGEVVVFPGVSAADDGDGGGAGVVEGDAVMGMR
ncbi:hypothetical protein AB0D90_21675 [Streptomyces althioticus]|uniref:hypothetical protein n=1 Tax=Streptomyces althioticus TaxID=83380 RepID=UPI0033F836A4